MVDENLPSIALKQGGKYYVTVKAVNEAGNEFAAYASAGPITVGVVLPS
jgi:hypothetical protein